MPIDLSKIDRSRISKGPTQKPQEPEQDGFSLRQTAKNVPQSAANFLSGFGQLFAHPIESVKTLGTVAAGGVSKLIPGKQTSEKSFDALTDFYKNRYGSVNKLLNTIQEDPVGFAADASVFLSAGGGLAAKVPGLAKTSNVLKTAARITDPLQAPMNIARGVRAATSATKSLFPARASQGFVETAPRVRKLSVSPAVKTNLPDISKDLIQGTFRLTRKEEVALGAQLDAAADIANRYRITGAPNARVQKINGVIDSMENQLSKTLKNVSGGARRDVVLQDLENLKGVYKNHIDFDDVVSQIDKVRANIQAKPGVIEYWDLNEIKRSAWNTAYSKKDVVIDEIRHAVGDVLNKRIVEDLKGIGVPAPAKKITVPIDVFNKEYGKILVLKKILRLAEARPQIAGVTSRLVGALLGSWVVGGAGGIIGGSLASPFLNSLPITSAISKTAVPLGKTLEAAQKTAVAEKPLMGAQRVLETQEEQ